MFCGVNSLGMAVALNCGTTIMVLVDKRVYGVCHRYGDERTDPAFEFTDEPELNPFSIILSSSNV